MRLVEVNRHLERRSSAVRQGDAQLAQHVQAALAAPIGMMVSGNATETAGIGRAAAGTTGGAANGGAGRDGERGAERANR